VTITDEDGRYAFEGIGAGAYELRAERAGFVSFPQRMLSLRRQVDAGKRVEADIALVRAATIHGQITDETGLPILLTSVTLQAAVTGRGSSTAFTTTNESGEYAFEGVTPGSYWVSAGNTGRDGEVTYYPGVVRPEDAAVLRVEGGDRLDGINITAPDTSSSILRGKIINFSDTKPDIRLVSSPAKFVRQATVREDGSFTFTGLKKGRYVITAVDVERQLAASHTIDLGARDQPIEIALQVMGSLRGQVVANKTDIRFDGMHVGAALMDRERDVDLLLPDKVEVEVDGKFEFRGLFGPRWLRVLNLPDGCALDEVRRANQVVNPPHVTLTGSDVINVTIALRCQ
jgi:protocatechuate 3,4-dioxygenase beta subunit